MEDRRVQDLELPLERDIFMRKMLRELTGVIENIVGKEAASGFIATVGSQMGQWIGEQYRQGLDVDDLDIEEIAQVYVDLKRRIGGDFYVISMSPDEIVLGNRACPFGEMVRGRTSLCMMTSNVFGRIAADNLGYARIDLRKTIAEGDSGCEVAVHLKPRSDAGSDAREYYRIERPGHVPSGN